MVLLMLLSTEAGNFIFLDVSRGEHNNEGWHMNLQWRIQLEITELFIGSMLATHLANSTDNITLMVVLEVRLCLQHPFPGPCKNMSHIKHKL